MKVPMLGGLNRRRVIGLLIILLLLGALVGYAVYHKYEQDKQAEVKRKNAQSKTVTNDQLASYKLNSAHQSLKKKDYESTAKSCDSAAALKYYEQKYQDAKTTLNDCIKDIPTGQLPWFIYKTRGVTEKSLGDKVAATKDLKIAIDKYALISDKSDELLSNMRQSLQDLSK